MTHIVIVEPDKYHKTLYSIWSYLNIHILLESNDYAIVYTSSAAVKIFWFLSPSYLLVKV